MEPLVCDCPNSNNEVIGKMKKNIIIHVNRQTPVLLVSFNKSYTCFRRQIINCLYSCTTCENLRCLSKLLHISDNEATPLQISDILK